MTSDPSIITATQNWLSRFIIEYNICPFAKQVRDQNRIRYQVSQAADTESGLQQLINECHYLDANPLVATTLLVFKDFLQDFDDYLDFLAIAEQLLADQGYEGEYQLASFHPQYCFAEAEPDDPANYTNRSPYPMLHLIREADIEAALKHYPNPEQIPERNMALSRQLGLGFLQALLKGMYSEEMINK